MLRMSCHMSCNVTDGGIHAREWVAISTATYLLDKLVTVFSTPATEEEDCAIKAAGITLFQAICATFNPPSPEYR